MARKLRFEFAGGLYHVLNRGNYRKWIFRQEGAKAAFEQTLFEACERCGWLLHAYVVMGNHYHLALETPEPNLSEGMRWLQSVFATRFNRFRRESGHLFQGRFKSIVVEDEDRLGALCHYIHLNPVRAGICEVEGLRKLPFCSMRHLWQKRQRPKFLRLESCLRAAGGLRDTPAGRAKYLQYLAWLAEDEPAQKDLAFERMSRGWVLGTKSFRKALLAEEKQKQVMYALGGNEARELREAAWELRLERCLELLGRTIEEAAAEPKSADWKVAIAAHMKTRLLCRNNWLGEQLSMGSESGVSRYVGQLLRGERPAAAKIFKRLNAKFTN